MTDIGTNDSVDRKFEGTFPLEAPIAWVEVIEIRAVDSSRRSPELVSFGSR